MAVSQLHRNENLSCTKLCTKPTSEIIKNI